MRRAGCVYGVLRGIWRVRTFRVWLVEKLIASAVEVEWRVSDAVVFWRKCAEKMELAHFSGTPRINTTKRTKWVQIFLEKKFLKN